METRSDLYYDPVNNKQLNKFNNRGDINLKQGGGVSPCFCMLQEHLQNRLSKRKIR